MTRPAPENERFLSRWSRLKRAQAVEAASTTLVPAKPSDAATTDQTGLSVPSERDSTGRAADVADHTVPALPAIESLTMESDYAQFFQPKVPEPLRRAAVKKLFADPHFNLMDGLDTYIDDYSKPDPIPPAMLARLLHARDIIDHPSNRKPEDAGQAPAAAPTDSGEQIGERAAADQADAAPTELPEVHGVEGQADLLVATADGSAAAPLDTPAAGRSAILGPSVAIPPDRRSGPLRERWGRAGV